jgi:hypothetical protein
MLLNAQPDIGTISEFDARGDIARNPDFMCSCGTPIRDCPFFTALVRKVNERGLDFSIDKLHEILLVHENPLIDRMLVGRLPYVRGTRAEMLRDSMVGFLPFYRKRALRFFERNDTLIRTILELQHASVFADANKDPHRMLLLSQRFDVKPVYIFKNGIAGVYSIVKNSARMGTPVTVGRASRRWFREQIGIANALNRMRTDYLQITYSDLCEDVAGTLKRITTFLGVAYKPVADLASTDHHIVGNRMRLGNISEIREDVSWKENLADQDIEVYRSTYREYAPLLKALNAEVLEHIWS